MLNVGAGAGAYEPHERRVVAAEPSAVMVAQRPPSAAPAVRARAEALPFADRAFEAVLATLTLHHWSDQRRGLHECRRVARDRVVLLTWDPGGPGFWLVRDYFPEIADLDRESFPTIAALCAMLGRDAEVIPVPIPADCTDGFLGAYWRRPEAYLVRGSAPGCPRSPASRPGSRGSRTTWRAARGPSGTPRCWSATRWTSATGWWSRAPDPATGPAPRRSLPFPPAGPARRFPEIHRR